MRWRMEPDGEATVWMPAADDGVPGGTVSAHAPDRGPFRALGPGRSTRCGLLLASLQAASGSLSSSRAASGAAIEEVEERGTSGVP